MKRVCCHVILLLLTTTSSCLNLRNIPRVEVLNVQRTSARDITPSPPAPIVVPPSTYFEGDDGKWSTFNVRVGTPEQSVRVIASTNSPQTLVVRPQGCMIGALPNGIPTNCAFLRGGTFDSDRSRSWIDQGWWGLNNGVFGYEANLGYNFNLDYGLDTLGLGFQEGTNAPTLKNQTVTAYNLASPLYLGLLGLGTQPVIFGTFGNYSVPSFFVSLRNQSLIPSLSWSYTAGAYYQLAAGQYSQLIFGGYDTSRFQSNGVEFHLSQDVTRDIVVGVQSILYSGVNSTSILSEPIYAFIESTDPNIWLPLSACLQFEQVFGLEYDNNTQKYLMNETHFLALSQSKPSVTFSLASSTTGGSTVDITLPFKAFGLQAQYPFVPNSTYYFPLKRAVNQSQYTLGRAFLQEAYLTVDYDRGNFSVSQCVWQQSATPNVQSILAPTYSTNNTNSTTSHSADTNRKSGTNTGAIAGSVTTVGALAIFGLLGFWFWRHRKQKREKEEESTTRVASVSLANVKPDLSRKDDQDLEDNVSMFGRYRKDTPASLYSHQSPGSKYNQPKSELPAHGHEVHEVSAVSGPSEMGDNESRIKFELETPVPVEMEGNNHWERIELPSPNPSRTTLSSHVGHTNSLSSLASTAGLTSSPVAWNLVSSRVSARSGVPMSISSIDEVTPPENGRPG